MGSSNSNADAKPPLDGIRVVDFTWIVAGPTCTRLLGDLGAEVIRVENEQTLDSIRFGRPHPNGFDPPDSGAMFNWLDRNKRSITVNARHPDGLDLIKRLIRVSDVVIENYSSRILENWGLSFEEQRAENSEIIYVSLSGFGHSGPQRDYSTWGPTAQALSGLTAMSGLPEAPEPAGWGYSYLDHMAGFTAAAAITAALRHRRETGQGQWIDLSQVETGMALTRSCNARFHRQRPPISRHWQPARQSFGLATSRTSQHLPNRRRRQLDHDHLHDRRRMGSLLRRERPPALAHRQSIRHPPRAPTTPG